MASELRVNTLKDASGNNSVGMSYVAEGTAKAWVNLNGTGTIATRDSFNISGTTDNGTGDYSFAINNDMNNNDYAIGSHTQRNASTTENLYCSSYQNDHDTAHAVGSFRISTNRPDNADHEDAQSLMCTVHGDLA
jgi:hypothetical protein